VVPKFAFKFNLYHYGLDVTATQFDVKQYYAAAPLAVWPAGGGSLPLPTTSPTPMCILTYVYPLVYPLEH
jgi:hypothetical protein